MNKILTELQIPKEQRALLLDLGIKDREQLALELASSYSYSIEINTAKEKPIKQLSLDSPESFIDEFGNEYTRDYSDTHEGFDYFKNGNLITKQQFDKEYQDSLDDVVENQNTQHYSNLTVPGGTNYTENAIQTPNIINRSTAHIKDFANGIANMLGWFRSDEKSNLSTRMRYLEEYRSTEEEHEELQRLYEIQRQGITSKTRRILEVQSDLFQKGRDKEDLISNNIKEVDDKIKSGLQSQIDALQSNGNIVEKNEGNIYPEIYINGILIEYPKRTSGKFDRNKTLESLKEEYNKNISGKKNTSENQFLQLLN